MASSKCNAAPSCTWCVGQSVRDVIVGCTEKWLCAGAAIDGVLSNGKPDPTAKNSNGNNGNNGNDKGPGVVGPSSEQPAAASLLGVSATLVAVGAALTFA